MPLPPILTRNMLGFGTQSLPSNNPCLSQFQCRRTAVAPDTRRRSHYEVLRVKHDASQKEIKTAYRALAKVYHPDAATQFMDSTVSVASDGRDFMEIRNAYSTLSDPNARAVYDSKMRTRIRAGPTRIRNWETDQCW